MYDVSVTNCTQFYQHYYDGKSTMLTMVIKVTLTSDPAYNEFLYLKSI